MEKTIRGWKDELMGAHRQMGDLFARSEVRERSLAYLEGLLSDCERKNGWQVAECVAMRRPTGCSICWVAHAGTPMRCRRG
jgi:hypothetical protein